MIGMQAFNGLLIYTWSHQRQSSPEISRDLWKLGFLVRKRKEEKKTNISV